MKLLSLECSAGPASVAVSEDGQILAEFYANVKLTHSETLLPMVQNALSAARLEMGEIDGFAVACGPGSFTGVRIGVAALKGMAWAAGKPCAAVSSLEGMALLLSGCRGVIVAAMDARCKQVYNALFYADGEGVRRLCPDRALMLEELSAELDTLAAETYADTDFFFCGDGAALAFDATGVARKHFAPPHLRYQRASGVALAAERLFASGEVVPAERLMPFYLRLPQAERELRAKQSASAK